MQLIRTVKQKVGSATHRQTGTEGGGVILITLRRELKRGNAPGFSWMNRADRIRTDARSCLDTNSPAHILGVRGRDFYAAMETLLCRQLFHLSLLARPFQNFFTWVL